MKEFLAVPLLGLLILSSEGIAQERAALGRAQLESIPSADSLRGLSSTELIKQLGKPDSVVQSGAREEWRYGNSLVFLQGGTVNAWSDSGDLINRRVLSDLKPQTGKSGELVGWKNAWERETPVSADDVIADLVKLP